MLAGSVRRPATGEEPPMHEAQTLTTVLPSEATALVEDAIQAIRAREDVLTGDVPTSGVAEALADWVAARRGDMDR